MIRKFLIKWLLSDHELRIKDIESHFVTKRDESGKPVETLADVPVEKRKELKLKMRGLSWAQQRALLEATDGGRRMAN